MMQPPRKKHRGEDVHMDKEFEDVDLGLDAGDEADGDAEPHLDGVVLGANLYLVDKAGGNVFHCTRNEDGSLVRAGAWVWCDQEHAKGRIELLAAADVPASVPASKPPADMAFPYPVDPDDHCETALRAYQDVEALLAALARALGKPRSVLFVYDPYFCNGAVVQNLASLGFTLVHNVRQDFYAVVEAGAVPDYDVLVTNPPYSGDHVERCLQFCVESRKPWLLLLPNHYYMKPFFLPTLQRSDVGPLRARVLSEFKEALKRNGTSSNVVVANSTWNLPHNVKASNDPRRKKKRKAKKKKTDKGGGTDVDADMGKHQREDKPGSNGDKNTMNVKRKEDNKKKKKKDKTKEKKKRKNPE